MAYPSCLPGGGADHDADVSVRRLRWRARRRRGRGNAGQTSAPDSGGDLTARARAAPGEAMAAAMQLAIALLTAGLDSPELEAWAAGRAHCDRRGWPGNCMVGLPACFCVLLLNELHEATGEPSAAILQRLAALAERQRGGPYIDYLSGVPVVSNPHLLSRIRQQGPGDPVGDGRARPDGGRVGRNGVREGAG